MTSLVDVSPEDELAAQKMLETLLLATEPKMFTPAECEAEILQAFARHRLTAEQANAAEIAERVEHAIELRRYLFGGEPLNANERNIVEGIRTAVLDTILNRERDNATG